MRVANCHCPISTGKKGSEGKQGGGIRGQEKIAMKKHERAKKKKKKPSEPLITLITPMTLIKHLSILIFGI